MLDLTNFIQDLISNFINQQASSSDDDENNDEDNNNDDVDDENDNNNSDYDDDYDMINQLDKSMVDEEYVPMNESFCIDTSQEDDEDLDFEENLTKN